MKVSNSGPKSNSGISNVSTTGSSDATKISREGRDGKSVGGEALSSAIGSSSKVDVSPRAQELKRAKELATAGDSIDEAKVARLQALIDKGQYKVDAGAIADKLLDEHMKMNE